MCLVVCPIDPTEYVDCCVGDLVCVLVDEADGSVGVTIPKDCAMRPRCCGLSGLFGGGYAGRLLAFVGDMSAISSSSAHDVPSRVGDFGVVGGGLLFAYPVRGDAPGNVAEGTEPAEEDDGGELSGLISDNRV